MRRRLKREGILKKINEYIIDNRLSININYLYNMGSIIGLVLGLQVITGIIVGMNYVGGNKAYESVEYIMREVKVGWRMRELHSNIASMIFIAMYIHIVRGLYYGSYRNKERKKGWRIGVIIQIVMIVVAFLGYTLPNTQMSLWGATVITNLLTAVPIVGREIVKIIWGGWSVGESTIKRFYVLHYTIPIVLIILAVIHLETIHRGGNNNPLGIGKEEKKINFNPYYTVKDVLGFIVIIKIISIVIIVDPNRLSHYDHYTKGNSMITPEHIVPEWYLLAYYGILRSIPSKTIGVIAMIMSIVVIIGLPEVDKGIVRSAYHSKLKEIVVKMVVINYIILVRIGGEKIEEPYITVGRVSTISYFLLIAAYPIVTTVDNVLYRYNK